MSQISKHDEEEPEEPFADYVGKQHHSHLESMRTYSRSSKSIRRRGTNLYTPWGEKKKTQVVSNDYVYFGGTDTMPRGAHKSVQQNFGQKTFMAHWKAWFKALQLLYLTVVFIILQVFTVYLIYEKWTLNKKELA